MALENLRFQGNTSAEETSFSRSTNWRQTHFLSGQDTNETGGKMTIPISPNEKLKQKKRIV
jgi:hypothetical protein